MTEPGTVIDGEQVTLVPLAPDDVERILAGDLGGRSAAPGWPHDDTPNALAFARDGAWSWLIVDEHDRVAGECGVKAPPDRRGRVEVGYGLAAGSRGQGLGTRAVTALVHCLLARDDVRAVEAEVVDGNDASSRLLERLGFVVVDHEAGRTRYARGR